MRFVLLLALVLSSTAARADDVQGFSFNSSRNTFQGMTRASGHKEVPAFEVLTWTPTEIGKTNLTGTMSFANAKYSRMGPRVEFQVQLIGLTTTAANTRTIVEVSFPINQTNVADMVNGVCFVQTGGTIQNVTGSIIDSTGGNNTTWAGGWQSSSSSVGLATTIVCHGWYYL